jgi:LmbE family N-acetylglucosaminyl deacetylase
MNLNNSKAEIYIYDDLVAEKAITRTTHMGIGAHQDDLEIFAFDGINKCFGEKDKWFCGITITNGAGSARTGKYANYSDEEMIDIRKKEQKKAALIGEYGSLFLLNYLSKDVKTSQNNKLIEDLKEIIIKARPEIIYTHNLADKHNTHVGAALRVIQAIREIPKEFRPNHLVGCEVWRSLDWVNDEDKLLFNVDGNPNIGNALVEVFDSQITGGKRYDLATKGRRIANATYEASHTVDSSQGIIYGMDLTPLIIDNNLNIKEYILQYIERFKKNVENKIDQYL